MNINDDQLVWLQGAITAQGYLIEILLGANLVRQGNRSPLELLEAARSAIQQQVKFDMSVPPTDHPRADHLAIQTSASEHVDELLDRVKTALVKRAASGGGT